MWLKIKPPPGAQARWRRIATDGDARGFRASGHQNLAEITEWLLEAWRESANEEESFSVLSWLEGEDGRQAAMTPAMMITVRKAKEWSWFFMEGNFWLQASRRPGPGVRFQSMRDFRAVYFPWGCNRPGSPAWLEVR